MTTQARQPRSYLRFWSINKFVRETVAALGLRPAEALVWIALWTAVNVKKGGLARLPHGQLARWVGLSVATTERAVRRLKELKLLIVVNAGRGRQVNVHRPMPMP